jgi:hypothetical protein
MSELNGKQRRLARARLKLGEARTWLEACDWVRLHHPDTSGDVERQLVRSLARTEGHRRIIA